MMILKRHIRKFNPEGHLYRTKNQKLKFHSFLMVIGVSVILVLSATAIICFNTRSEMLWCSLLLGHFRKELQLPECKDMSWSTVGRVQVPTEVTNVNEAVAMLPGMKAGGRHCPRDCKPKDKTAIVIPFQDRQTHLDILLAVLLPMLVRQGLDFCVFVIEQMSRNEFNKSLLTNVGYIEALKIDDFDCFIFHDVDLVPIDDRNIYRCHTDGPVHMAAAINKFNYSLMYHGYFGGVVAFTRKQYLKINGASNMYFGWGADDDDLRDRVTFKNLTLFRKTYKYGAYDMLYHTDSKKNSDRFKVYKTRKVRQDYDGLNSVVYTSSGLLLLPAYTRIGVSYDRVLVEKAIPLHIGSGPTNDFEYMQAKFVTIE
ncbi:beta-N-acetyl-D-glucosaminide beta-1,4-N-acetylglucosaminyl-transferase-like [Biomphalaria glabrata]|uniref:Beta-1,4-galactosyltransferase n=1 Tax=Biomphalaria glabrata TaxID=6526 RepID=A0A9W3B8P2_BIOGL|nr:beta-N-acetyl-D-glucosaminide beta-1,4-N-acetylglucosaminyl-transferase-like [Biomphalaria glabrata]